MTAKTDTQITGLIGWPVEHSISPAMFNAAFQALKMDWQYKTFPIEPESLAEYIQDLRRSATRGLNVTVPHKRGVMALLDVLQPEAKAIGAVNTITVLEGEPARLEGTNTDASGFYKDLTSHISPSAKEAQALILGAGGAARAAAYVLSKLGYQLFIASRDPKRGLELIRSLQASLSSKPDNQEFASTHWRMQMRAVPWENIPQVTENLNLIVNCTPVGMWPKIDESPWPENARFPTEATVYDMVYRPQETRLLREAKAAGAQAISGLGMLVRQGAASFEIWTGKEAPIEIMHEAAQQALNA